MDCFYIITNKLKDPDYAVTDQIRSYIEQSGRKAVLSVKDEEGHIVPGTVPEDADCALVLGGDGTLIRAVRDMDGSAMPLLGINLGTLGYLTDVELKEFRPALDRLFTGDFDIEERMMIEGVTADGYRDLAVNDIVLAREGKIRIVQFNLYVNGTLLNTYLADGVIISTPTGSTGYNLSAGGPVVEPTASMIVITPICSHALNTSSVVLSADGYIITNTHVIEGCSSVEVVLQDDSSYEALLVGMDVPTDLAVLKIDAQNLHPAVFGNSDELPSAIPWARSCGAP